MARTPVPLVLKPSVAVAVVTTHNGQDDRVVPVVVVDPSTLAQVLEEPVSQGKVFPVVAVLDRGLETLLLPVVVVVPAAQVRAFRTRPTVEVTVVREHSQTSLVPHTSSVVVVVVVPTTGQLKLKEVVTVVLVVVVPVVCWALVPASPQAVARH